MTTELRTWFDKAGPVAQSTAALATLFAVTLTLLLLWRATRLLRGKKAADTLTVVAAAMASSVAATGMWHFFSRTMHLPVWIQAVLFAFMEISVLASALRARANVARDGNAGADGLAVWVLTCASGLMSASEASSPQEALVRLGAPLVAAWLWERSMVPERRAQRAAKGTAETAVRWLFSVKRIAVRLGLATALGADLETEDANRRIDRFVRADNRAQRAGFLTRRHAGRRRDRSHARLMEQARMQADPRALYAHLGRQAILDVLARLGGDDAVIDRERARQMQHILADATREQPGQAGQADQTGQAGKPGASAATAARPQHAGSNGADLDSPLLAEATTRFTAPYTPYTPFAPQQDELPLQLPENPAPAPATLAAANGAQAGFHIPAARHAPGHAANHATPANGQTLTTHANGATAPASAPAAVPGPQQQAQPQPQQQQIPAPDPLAEAAPPRSNQIPVGPVRFAAPPIPEPVRERVYTTYDETDYDEPEPEPEPGPTPPPANTVLDQQLAARITRAIAASPSQPNLLKLANELGISIAHMQDTIEELGGFNAVLTRARQDRDAESSDADLTFYPA